MASLIEELINTLEEENSHYEVLLKLSKEKSGIIIKNDIQQLREMVAQEQTHTDRLASLEVKRSEVVTDIATVLNRDADTLTIKNIIELLKGQDEVQKRLAKVHDRLKQTLNDVASVNELNQELLKESLEMLEFNINYINGLRQIPETANYTNQAYNAEGYAYSTFDAKN